MVFVIFPPLTLLLCAAFFESARSQVSIFFVEDSRAPIDIFKLVTTLATSRLCVHPPGDSFVRLSLTINQTTLP